MHYYLKRIDLGVSLSKKYPQINAFLQNKWYLDDINEKIFVKGSRKLAREVLEVDAKVVDGVVNLTGLLTLGSGEGLKYFETGRAQFYALIVFGGVFKPRKSTQKIHPKARLHRIGKKVLQVIGFEQF